MLTTRLTQWGLLYGAALTGVVFQLAAIQKLADRRRFEDVVLNYRLVSARAAHHIATILPFVELAVGASLMLGLQTRTASLAAFALLASFSIAIGLNLIKGRVEISCGCFGSAVERLTWTAVGRNVGMCAIMALEFSRADATRPLLDPHRFAAIGGAIVTVVCLWLGFTSLRILRHSDLPTNIDVLA